MVIYYLDLIVDIAISDGMSMEILGLILRVYLKAWGLQIVLRVKLCRNNDRRKTRPPNIIPPLIWSRIRMTLKTKKNINEK
jgi:hypothetical protein